MENAIQLAFGIKKTKDDVQNVAVVIKQPPTSNIVYCRHIGRIDCSINDLSYPKITTKVEHYEQVIRITSDQEFRDYQSHDENLGLQLISIVIPRLGGQTIHGLIAVKLDQETASIPFTLDRSTRKACYAISPDGKHIYKDSGRVINAFDLTNKELNRDHPLYELTTDPKDRLAALSTPEGE